MEQVSLFQNFKFCSVCRRPMPLDFPKELCPICEENELFGRVKEYIRSGDVTEYQVAEKFNIPLRKVKAWIQEGRIEYKEINRETITGLKCMSCGESIAFGTYCQKCYKQKNAPKGTYFGIEQDDKMRFLE